MSAVLEAHEPSAKYLSDLQPKLVQHFELLGTAPGGVAKLRELILTLAVQGKLVPQDPADESASDLLEMIRMERSIQVAEEKLKQEKRSGQIEEVNLPCNLPKKWVWVSLSQLGDFRGGKTPSTQNLAFWGGEIPWITPKDMKQLNLSDSEDHVTQRAVDDGLALVPSQSVLVVVRSGILRRSVPTAVNQVNTTINQDLKALVLVRPELATYVQLMLRGFERFILENLTKVGTTVESIQFDAFAAQPFPLPPLAEQSRIAARVEELLRLCDALEAKGQLEAAQHAQLVQTLLGALTASATPDELADNWQRVATHFDILLDRPEAVDALEQTILHLAVRGLLVPQNPNDEPASVLLQKICAEKDRLIAEGKIKRDKPLADIAKEEKPFQLPEGWEWAEALELCSLITDGDHQAPPKADSGIPFLVIGDVRSGFVDLGSASRYVPSSYFEALDWGKKPRLGDVLYTTVGSFGIPVPITQAQDFCFQRHIALFRPAVASVQEFLTLSLGSKLVYVQAEKGATGIAQKTVPLSVLRRLMVPLPPLLEQHRIVARVESLRRLCADLRQRLAARQNTQAHLAEALIDEVA
jgi:type I restriction enzyme S subunit